jgi:hypothetical protein
LFLLLGLSEPARANPFSYFWSKEKRASEESQALAKEKKYADAVDLLKGLQAEDPDNPEVNYNIGTYLLHGQKGRLGREQLSHLRNADGKMRELALFNTAGSLAQEGKKPEARAAYAELLQRLQSRTKLNSDEEKLLAQTKRNVARLADPAQQPPPQPDKSENKQEQQPDQKQDQKKDSGSESKEPKQGGGGDDKKDQKQDKGDDKKDSKGDQKDDKNKSDGDNKKDDAKKDGDKDGDKKKDQQEKKEGEGKEDKGKGADQGKSQGQQMPRRGNQPFKERDNMGEDDAKRILGALKERESDLQKKFLKNKVKGGKVNVDDAAKDW